MAVSGLLLTILAVAWFIIFALNLVQWFAAMNYARRMAARVPDRTIASRARALIWGPIWTLVAVCGGLGICLIVGLSVHEIGPVMIIPGCLFVIGGLIASVVFYVIYAMLLDRLRVSLAAARKREAPMLAAPGLSPSVIPPPLPSNPPVPPAVGS